MKIIKSKYTIPFYNFALEELLLKNDNLKDEDILLIYQNNNSIIIGKNQNTHEEINEGYTKEMDIKIARRISGGGAVYHDLGNVNFCFITGTKNSSYYHFLEPIIGFLKTLGIEAKFHGKNDVLADGFKISGNAQYKYKDRMFHHGTLLFDSKMETLSKALKPNPLKFQSKSIKSVRKRVANIRTLLVNDMTTEQFIEELIEYFVKSGNQVEKEELISKDDIDKLAKIKSQDSWNFGKNPPYDYSCQKRFDGGTIGLKIKTTNDIIDYVKFEGDFMSSNSFDDIHGKIEGQVFDTQKIMSILKEVKDFSNYFGTITKEEVISLFVGVESEI